MSRLHFLTAGESHGPCLTAIVEGLPAGLPVDMEAINRDLRRAALFLWMMPCWAALSSALTAWRAITSASSSWPAAIRLRVRLT